jgi:hypothetical protein
MWIRSCGYCNVDRCIGAKSDAVRSSALRPQDQTESNQDGFLPLPRDSYFDTDSVFRAKFQSTTSFNPADRLSIVGTKLYDYPQGIPPSRVSPPRRSCRLYKGVLLPTLAWEVSTLDILVPVLSQVAYLTGLVIAARCRFGVVIRRGLTVVVRRCRGLCFRLSGVRSVSVCLQLPHKGGFWKRGVTTNRRGLGRNGCGKYVGIARKHAF